MNAIRFHTEIGPDGIIRPPGGVSLPAGQAEVIVLSEPVPVTPTQPNDHLIDRLIRASEELGVDPTAFPEDLAENHEYYAHGAPKGIDRQ